ncbi:MFS transporter [Mycolicibacterium austroafricanum]|uniref:MFS transporter n=1 Tax=Mycolicibacterium austroafricanum TaxID=39687 RepID=A0ABT8HPK1_MYCAO|nr:MFS transporter [Mycolicibacterium austroafricanum]MDN4522688.1 MFS transporter [Mycolicibacterium austroafricanum]QRZ06957.1 MFS transporter [Mycolicibacterium austroafricanum]QZT68440.1 MFS transporter [Mycolicibacterium austroafricanum]
MPQAEPTQPHAPSCRKPSDARSWSDEERRRVQRRTLVVVIASQVLGGAGLAAGVSVGALLAKEMLGTESLAGIPAALFTLGSAAAAFSIGRLTQSWGRRVGLGIGFTAGGVGAAGVVVAAASDNAPLLFAALFIYGAGTATNLQARYAGTDLADPSRRGTAISVALTATTLGAVAGPNLIAPMGQVAVALGIPALAGPFLLAAVAYVAAGSVLIALLRPDPYLVARQIDAASAREGDDTSVTAAPRPTAGAYVGAVVMIVAQVAMAAIMTMTPVHMSGHHHGLSAVGLVIGLHIAAMYLPSLVTGVLVDRIGPHAMAVAAGITLLAAGLTAAFAPGDSLPLLVTALVLLGLGWNFGIISGTAFVVDATVPANRPRVQGSIDVLIAIAGAAGGGLSGVVMSAGGYAALSIACGVFALVLLPALLWDRKRTPAS